MEEGTANKQPNKADRLIPYRWPKGTSGNPKGRALSPTTRIREMFKENPDQFDEWLEDYLNDKQNRKHVVEMLDGKPKQQIAVKDEVDVEDLSELSDEELEKLITNANSETSNRRESEEGEG